MLSTVISGTILGIDALRVEVEVNAGEPGEPSLVLVGLPSASVRESRQRVLASLMNGRFEMPERRCTINLAPGHLRKEGALFDLPIALGLLAATRQIEKDRLEDFMVAGELSLSGEARPIRGGIALACRARDLGMRGIILPPKTASEAAVVKEIPVYEVKSLNEAVAFLEGRTQIQPVRGGFSKAFQKSSEALDFSEVKGQLAVRRAVEIAVAGGHNLLMLGPPGSGKSMIAKRIPTIMPDLTEDEYLDILRIYSAAGKTLTEGALPAVRPFRSPHHTISDAGLVGGGTVPGPGEISLAHNGVLFLDELPEFKRSALEVLRQPLEDREVTISRSAGQITLPARCMLIAAMNPTPCGGIEGKISSTPAQIQRYRSRLSGPLLDRIDIHIEAPALRLEELNSSESGESSQAMKERIQTARDRQIHRFPHRPSPVNAAMSPSLIRKHCALTDDLTEILTQSMRKLHLSARAFDRILKVSRTIADLEGADQIQQSHLMEAIHYRSLDRA